MRDVLLDILCFIAMAAVLEACAQSAEETHWGDLNYPQAACKLGDCAPAAGLDTGDKSHHSGHGKR